MCRTGSPDPAVVGQPAVVEMPTLRAKAADQIVPQQAPAVAAQPTEAVEAMDAAAAESAPNWPDEAAESAMVSELRSRGEVVASSPSAGEVAEETDSRPLPPLNDLVQKIPAEVRDALEDLFRARFVTVKRVSKKALK